MSDLGVEKCVEESVAQQELSFVFFGVGVLTNWSWMIRSIYAIKSDLFSDHLAILVPREPVERGVESKILSEVVQFLHQWSIYPSRQALVEVILIGIRYREEVEKC